MAAAAIYVSWRSAGAVHPQRCPTSWRAAPTASIGRRHRGCRRRRLIGDRRLIGLDPHAAADADAIGVDYIGVGPVHATPTAGPPGRRGRARRDAAAHATVPWFAIGGIDEQTMSSATGRRIAVVRAIADAADPGGDRPGRRADPPDTTGRNRCDDRTARDVVDDDGAAARAAADAGAAARGRRAEEPPR
jgi:hypothetical protein